MQKRAGPGLCFVVLAVLLAIHAPGNAADVVSPGEATCQHGRAAFCMCKPEIERVDPSLCKNILLQCHQSFCQPLCLRMAWRARVRARCDRMPTWRGCREFADHLKRAERAITAQFQAHVCFEDLDCCTNTTKLLDWVEDHVFADMYPSQHLPLQACTAPSSPHPTRTPCQLCQEAIEVEVDADGTECLPPHKGAEIQPFSLHERVRCCPRQCCAAMLTLCPAPCPASQCLFLSDIVANRKDVLERELKEMACSCSGCCEGGCYFRDREQDWLGCVPRHAPLAHLAQSLSFACSNVLLEVANRLEL